MIVGLASAATVQLEVGQSNPLLRLNARDLQMTKSIRYDLMI
jgi:hypothetical protein